MFYGICIENIHPLTFELLIRKFDIFSPMNFNFVKPLGSEAMIHDPEIFRLVLASDI